MTRRPGGGNRPWDKDSCLERGKREGKKSRKARPRGRDFCKDAAKRRGPLLPQPPVQSREGGPMSLEVRTFLLGRREKVQVPSHAWEARVSAPQRSSTGRIWRVASRSHTSPVSRTGSHTQPHIMSASSRGTRAAVPLLRSKYMLSQQANSSMSRRTSGA